MNMRAHRTNIRRMHVECISLWFSCCQLCSRSPSTNIWQQFSGISYKAVYFRIQSVQLIRRVGSISVAHFDYGFCIIPAFVRLYCAVIPSIQFDWARKLHRKNTIRRKVCLFHILLGVICAESVCGDVNNSEKWLCTYLLMIMMVRPLAVLRQNPFALTVTLHTFGHKLSKGNSQLGCWFANCRPWIEYLHYS